MVRIFQQRLHKRILLTSLTIILDLIVTAGILLSIYYFNYMIPYKFDTPNISFNNSLFPKGNIQSPFPDTGNQILSGKNPFFGTDGILSGKNNGTTVQESTGGSGTDFGGKFSGKFSDKAISTANSYRSKDLSIAITPYQSGSGENKITYYVADVYTSNINCFRTYFGQNTYSAGYTEHLTDMSRDVHAIFAMNGDSYCYNRQHTAGVLIRNGTLYRAEPTTSDVCILYKNGEMKTYSPDQFDLQQVSSSHIC